MTQEPLLDFGQEQLSEQEIYDLCMQTNFWTWSAQAHVKPIAVDHAKGVYFWDIYGKRYLDFNSMVMCVNIGHEDERVVEAIVHQAREMPFAGPNMATKPRALLGKALRSILPDELDHYLYTLGGADANENAVKLARAYTGKFKILTRYRSYHGASYGAIALTGDPRRLVWEPSVMMGVVHFLDPYRYRSTFHQNNPNVDDATFARDYLNHLEEIIMYEGPETIAAVMIETITGTNGVIIPPDGYLQGIRALCDKYNIVMICDEVMSGFGRTGEWFAFNHWNIVPDIVTMAKGLSSGYAPLGAVAMKHKIAEAFAEKVYQGGLTYNGHAIALAAAYTVIQVMKQDKLVERAKETGKVLTRLLEEMKEKHPSVGDVRSLGLFGVIELVKNRESKEPMAPYNGTSPEMIALKKFMLDAGIYLYTHWHTVLIVPPLIITVEQLQEGFTVLDEALKITDAAVTSSV
ncbi:MAG: aspartate aminotransferase family protein [Chloroflexi bacterium HGW-Chloroflexi-10]|nr:MAG: aspartate aminotransferase family protein [Chloroflexi bacterium HGW-Chloroflexi-10]